MSGSGKITTEYTVWCYKCDRWHQTAEHKNKHSFGVYLKIHGWLFTRAWGWICPTHNEWYQKLLEKEKK